MLSASPDNTEAIEPLAWADARLGKTEEAGKRLERALEKFPANLQATVALARLRLSKNDTEGAETVLKNALGADPKSTDASVALAQFHILLRKDEAAEVELRRALARDPKHAPALLTLASILMRHQRLDEAGQMYTTVSTLPQREFKSAHAEFLFQTGRHEAARAEFAKLSEQDPGDVMLGLVGLLCSLR